MQQSRMGKPHLVTLPQSPLQRTSKETNMARFGHFKELLFSFVCLPAFAFTTNAQTPTVVLPSSEQPRHLTSQSTLYCAGYIKHDRIPHMPEIVGAEEEQEQRKFSDGDIVYLDAGSQQGI